MPSYPHEPVTKPFHRTSIRTIPRWFKRAGWWMQKKKHSGSALRAWIRGRYDVRVKRPRRELVPRRLTSVLEDMCRGPKRLIVR